MSDTTLTITEASRFVTVHLAELLEARRNGDVDAFFAIAADRAISKPGGEKYAGVLLSAVKAYQEAHPA